MKSFFRLSPLFAATHKKKHLFQCELSCITRCCSALSTVKPRMQPCLLTTKRWIAKVLQPQYTMPLSVAKFPETSSLILYILASLLHCLRSRQTCAVASLILSQNGNIKFADLHLLRQTDDGRVAGTTDTALQKPGTTETALLISRHGTNAQCRLALPQHQPSFLMLPVQLQSY